MNNVKTALWMTVLTVLFVLVGRLVAGDGGMIASLVLALVLNGVAYWFSDRIALRMAHAEEMSAADAPLLHDLARRLALHYGIPKPRVYISPDPTPNAFATGRSPQHAAIVVNRGLLEQLDAREPYGVLGAVLDPPPDEERIRCLKSMATRAFALT